MYYYYYYCITNELTESPAHLKGFCIIQVCRSLQELIVFILKPKNKKIITVTDFHSKQAHIILKVILIFVEKLLGTDILEIV